MKKLALIASFITSSFLVPVQVWAQDQKIQITAPTGGFKALGDAVSKIVTVALAVSVILVLAMLVWGAFEWITSGGDKEAVGHARNRIINALIGMAVLAIAFALAKVAAQFLGFDIGNISIPTPDPNARGL